MKQTQDKLDTRSRVVVGVDGSPESVTALRAAKRHADSTGAVIEAIAAWEHPVTYGGFPLAADRDWSAVAAQTLQSALSAAFGPERDGIRSKVVQGRLARVLRQQAVGAQLLVVGGHSHRAPRAYRSAAEPSAVLVVSGGAGSAVPEPLAA